MSNLHNDAVMEYVQSIAAVSDEDTARELLDLAEDDIEAAYYQAKELERSV